MTYIDKFKQNPQDSPEFKYEFQEQKLMLQSFINCLIYCSTNYSRDFTKHKINFFIKVVDDLIQSIAGIHALSEQGIRNTSRRELRYVLEASIKACYISQQYNLEEIAIQIEIYDKILKDHKITQLNDIKLSLLESTTESEIKEEIKRTYGYLCKYIHFSPHQMNERLNLYAEEKFIGFEGAKELEEFNREMERVLSYVIVLFFHSIPEWVIGDFLVNRNGEILNWFFNRSKYIAFIDETFDYKSERQHNFGEIKKIRKVLIKF